LECLQENWETLAKQKEFAPVESAIGFQGMDPHLQLMVLLSPFIKSIHSNLVLPAGSYSKSYASAWIQASIQSQSATKEGKKDFETHINFARFGEI